MKVFYCARSTSELGLIADLVEGIRGVGDQLAQEHLLVGVEGVDDDFCVGPNIAV